MMLCSLPRLGGAWMKIEYLVHSVFAAAPRAVRAMLLTALVTATMTRGAAATTIGVSMALFDDPFLTQLRQSLLEYATRKPGLVLQIEDAQGEVGKQLSDVQGFIADKADAIVVNPVDTDATLKLTALASTAGIALVYLNRLPADLPPHARVAFVGSDERLSGTLEAKAVCKLLAGKGQIVILMGDLANQAARQRTADVEDVIKTPECAGMNLVEKQSGNWERIKAFDLVSGWINAGLAFDAVVANNDEMALGAIEALKAAGKPIGAGAGKVLVAGVDGTPDALVQMKAGNLAVTVFQDAAGQAKGAIDTALILAAGEKAEPILWVPFELITPATIGRYAASR